MLLLSVFSSGFCTVVEAAVFGIWAVWSDGTAEVVNNLLQRTTLCRVTNVCQRNGPREVRAGLLTSAPLSANTYLEQADAVHSEILSLMAGVFYENIISLSKIHFPLWPRQ